MDSLRILYESAWTASLIPLGHDTTFFAMKSFGSYDMTLPLVLSVIGGTIGQCANYALGRFLLYYGHRTNAAHNIPRYLRFAHLFGRYGIWTLLFCWLPLGKLLPLVAGFGNARLRWVFLLVLAGEAVNYGRVLAGY